MDRKCSVTRSAKRRFVSPIYKIAHRLQVKTYTTLVEVQVKFWLMLKQLLLGPTTERSLSRLTTGQVLHRPRLQGKVPGGSGFNGWG